MSRCILDTDIVSFNFKNDSRATMFDGLLAGKQLAISFVTMAELCRWPLARGWGRKRIQALEAALAHYFILHSNPVICREWAKIVSIKGRPMGYHDAWIAATALAYDLPLLTHNRQDFEHVPGLVLLNGKAK